MPELPPRPCSFPGCPELVYDRRPLCATHRRIPTSSYQGSSSAVYGPGWNHFARQYLRRHPSCAFCGGQAEQVDHIDGDKRNRREWNLRPLCAPCHRRRTAEQFRRTHWRHLG